MRHPALVLLLVVLAGLHGYAANRPSRCDTRTLADEVLSLSSGESWPLRLDTQVSLALTLAKNQSQKAAEICSGVISQLDQNPSLAGPFREIFLPPFVGAYAAADFAKAHAWVRSLPARYEEGGYVDYKARAYDKLIEAAEQQRLGVADELVTEALASGAFQVKSVAPRLGELSRQSPGAAAVLFKEVLAAFPAHHPTDEDVLQLLKCIRASKALPVPLLEQAVDTMIRAVKREDFADASKLMLVTTTFQGEGNPVETSSATSALLVQIAALAKSAGVYERYRDYLEPYGRLSTKAGSSLERDSVLILSQTFVAPGALGRHVSDRLSDEVLHSALPDALETCRSERDPDFRAELFSTLLQRPDAAGRFSLDVGDEVMQTAEAAADTSLAFMLSRLILTAAVESDSSSVGSHTLAAVERIRDRRCTDQADWYPCLEEYRRLPPMFYGSSALSEASRRDVSIRTRLLLRQLQRCSAAPQSEPKK